MTIPRSVALRKTDDGLRIVQSPVATLKTIRRPPRAIDARPIPPGETNLGDRGIEGLALEIISQFEPADADEFGLKVRCGPGEETLIGVDRRAGTVFVDRTKAGASSFSPHFAGRHSARLATAALAPAQPIQLHVIVDATSVEVFAAQGQVVLTDQIFPKPTSRGVSLYAKGGTARLRSLESWELRP